MDRNRLLLIGGAIVLALFLAYLAASGGLLPGVTPSGGVAPGGGVGTR